MTTTEARRTYNAAYREKHRERLKAYDRARYQAKRDEYREAGRAWYQKHRQEQLDAYRLRTYGITPEEYAARIASQDGRCAICRQPMVKPHVDHDHATGVVRGILCGGCNAGIGNFADDPLRLEAAIRYLTPVEGEVQP